MAILFFSYSTDEAEFVFEVALLQRFIRWWQKKDWLKRSFYFGVRHMLHRFINERQDWVNGNYVFYFHLSVGRGRRGVLKCMINHSLPHFVLAKHGRTILFFFFSGFVCA